MKKDLRYKFKKIRKKIKNKFLKDKIIYYKIITKKEVKEASLILIYVSCNDEVNTIPLIKHFIRKGIPIAVPKVSLDKMDFYYIKSLKDLKKGYKGIYEPVPNNLVTSFNKTVSRQTTFFLQPSSKRKQTQQNLFLLAFVTKLSPFYAS